MFNFSSFPDHLCVRIRPDAELHRTGPLVRYLSPADVQEHGQEGLQEYSCHLGCVVHHHDPSGDRDGLQQPAARTHKQDQPVYRVWRTLGRLVIDNPPLKNQVTPKPNDQTKTVCFNNSLFQTDHQESNLPCTTTCQGIFHPCCSRRRVNYVESGPPD